MLGRLWRSGQRRRVSATDRLDAEQWHEVMIGPSLKGQLLERVRKRELTEWGRLMVELTAPGNSVLEIGSGTAEISLALAGQGRDVTLLDFSQQSLEFARDCAKDLGVSVGAVLADATAALPLRDNQFDCVWSSGLLEHFDTPARPAMLREQARVSRGQVVSLVPNAACLAYRVGKADQEARHVWPYGLEMPLYTQQADFAQAGLQLRLETTIGAAHALQFLRPNHPLRPALTKWVAKAADGELREFWQGYLLVTVGVAESSYKT